MRKIDNFSWIQHEPGQIDNVERTCLSKKIYLSSPRFDQPPQQLFKVRRKLSCLHKFWPWAYSRLDQPREGRRTRKPDSFLSPDHPPSASCGAAEWSPHVPCAHIHPTARGTLAAVEKREVALSQPTNYPQIIQAAEAVSVTK